MTSRLKTTLLKIVSSASTKPLLCWLLVLWPLMADALPETVEPEYRAAYNLEDQWLIHDDSYKGYVPYFRRQYGVQPTVSLVLDLEKYRRYRLLLQVPQTTHVFVQSRLSRTLPASARMVLSIDSLQKKYNASSILLTLYQPGGHVELPLAQIVYVADKMAAKSGAAIHPANKTSQPKLRLASDFQDFATLTAIILLIFYTFLLNYYPKAFERNFSPQSLTALDLRGDVAFMAKPLNPTNLLFLDSHSMLLSLFYMIGQRYSDGYFANLLPFEASEAFSGLCTYFLVFTALLFAVLVGKYFFIYAMGVVFDMGKTTSPHYHEYLIFSRLFFLAAVLIQFVLLITYPQWLWWLMPLVLVSIVMFNIIRILTIGTVLNKLTSFRNLYLFSYLCATELIPLLVGVKLLAK